MAESFLPVLLLMVVAAGIAGALSNRPVEVVKAETSDLLVPATAEIVIEGEIEFGKTLPEGPFGEYPGYYTGAGAVEREFIKVKTITHRNRPILWSTTVGKPITDTHMIMGINRTASLWNDLQNMKIPGIMGVYGPPAAAGRMLAKVSLAARASKVLLLEGGKLSRTAVDEVVV